MKSDSHSDDQLRLAARLYYVDGFSQGDVAQFVNVSQAKVSRMLAIARSRGIVSISVLDYDPRNAVLEAALRSRLGINDIAVIKNVPEGAQSEARMAVGHFGASLLDPLVPAGSIVAISGGRTMRELIRMLPKARRKNLTIIQSMGSLENEAGPVDASELARLMAQRWHGKFITMATPAYVTDETAHDRVMAQEGMQEAFQMLGSANVALVGVGTLENSIFAEHGILTPADAVDLETAGAVGEICGRFYDIRGNECHTPWRQRVVSMTLDILRSVPCVIGVVAGADRSLAVLSAIRGRLINSLVIDERGATALLDLAE